MQTLDNCKFSGLGTAGSGARASGYSNALHARDSSTPARSLRNPLRYVQNIPTATDSKYQNEPKIIFHSLISMQFHVIFSSINSRIGF